MAALTEDQIKKYWENPENRAELNQADKDNQRQLFHAMLSTDLEDAGTYKDLLLGRVKRMLRNAEKYRKFEDNITFPLPSHNLVSKATDELNKIFRAQDREVDYVFSEEEYTQDFTDFLNKISFSSTIEQHLFTKAKQCVNTLAIVDTPALSDVVSPGLTEPYIYFIEAGKIHSLSVDEKGVVKYVMFTRDMPDDKKDLIIIDEENYSVAHLDQDGKINGIESSPHFLEYCPATFIWRDVKDPDKPIRRYNSILEIVGDMDKYVIASVFKEHVDLYASFPIIWRYKDDCEEELDTNGDPIINENEESDYLGPGHMLEMTLPEGENAKMGIPVGFANAERTMLDYNVEKLEKLEIKITKHLTGVDNEIQNEKAFNESQIRSQYETRHSVLRYWAENIEYCHKFLMDTVARLRYMDKFISSTVYYGMDYFLYDTITATTEYQETKDAGLPFYIRIHKRKVVEEITTRNSPNTKARFEILNQIEPFLDCNLEEIPDMTGPEYWLKVNFAYYINRFEREVGSITKFAAAIDFRVKIDKINKKLYEYVEQDIAAAQKRADRLEAKRIAGEKQIRAAQSSQGQNVRKSGQGSEV